MSFPRAGLGIYPNLKQRKTPNSTMAQSLPTRRKPNKKNGPPDWMSRTLGLLQEECMALSIFDDQVDRVLTKPELSARLSCYDVGMYNGHHFDSNAIAALQNLWHIAGSNSKKWADLSEAAKAHGVSGTGTKAEIIASVARKIKEDLDTQVLMSNANLTRASGSPRPIAEMPRSNGMQIPQVPISSYDSTDPKGLSTIHSGERKQDLNPPPRSQWHQSDGNDGININESMDLSGNSPLQNHSSSPKAGSTIHDSEQVQNFSPPSSAPSHHDGDDDDDVLIGNEPLNYSDGKTRGGEAVQSPKSSSDYDMTSPKIEPNPSTSAFSAMRGPLGQVWNNSRSGSIGDNDNGRMKKDISLSSAGALPDALRIFNTSKPGATPPILSSRHTPPSPLISSQLDSMVHSINNNHDLIVQKLRDVSETVVINKANTADMLATVHNHLTQRFSLTTLPLAKIDEDIKALTSQMNNVAVDISKRNDRKAKARVVLEQAAQAQQAALADFQEIDKDMEESKKVQEDLAYDLLRAIEEKTHILERVFDRNSA